MPDPEPNYGAVFADVKALLPWRRFTAESKPTQTDVELYITSVASVLGIEVEPITDDEAKAARLTALCRRAVALGAASHAEAAAMPEKARPNDVSSYASWLWERYEEALAEITAYVEELNPGGTTEPGVATGDPAWNFPTPVGWAARGI